MFTKILVALDFEQQSDKAIRTAVALARDTATSVTLAHVYDASGSAQGCAYVKYTPEEGSRVAADLRQRLDSLKTFVQQGGVQNVGTCLIDGKAAPAIVQAAREGDYDLIIMGTHGRTGLRLKLLGSVAQAVLSEAPCAVLTVRNKEYKVVAPTPRETAKLRVIEGHSGREH
jgi:nucleotide-binding universal stress UspA family protein